MLRFYFPLCFFLSSQQLRYAIMHLHFQAVFILWFFPSLSSTSDPPPPPSYAPPSNATSKLCPSLIWQPSQFWRHLSDLIAIIIIRRPQSVERYINWEVPLGTCLCQLFYIFCQSLLSVRQVKTRNEKRQSDAHKSYHAGVEYTSTFEVSEHTCYDT